MGCDARRDGEWLARVRASALLRRGGLLSRRRFQARDRPVNGSGRASSTCGWLELERHSSGPVVVGV